MNDLRLPQMTFEEAKQILEMEVDWDWEKFRREAAKDILAAIITGDKPYGAYPPSCEELSNRAILYADTLIAKLKEK